MTVLGSHGPLRLRRLDRALAADYAWLSPATRAAFAGQTAPGRGSVWGLTWTAAGLVAPLAELTPGGLLRRPALTHLVPGRPTTPL